MSLVTYQKPLALGLYFLYELADPRAMIIITRIGLEAKQFLLCITRPQLSSFKAACYDSITATSTVENAQFSP